MHAKYALALILALQVSVSLCEPLPPPSQELVDKYNDMKATFYRRVLNLVARVQATLQPQMDTENGQILMSRIQDVGNDPRYQAFRNVMIAMSEEFAPIVDQARLSLLAQYEYKMRPRVGVHLNNIIDTMKIYLDKYLPAN